ncbi:prephenate dehydrogenase [Phragmitibacter flavus]|uniref:prephenate dehydrogenase n=1 Tax=Phragmitibacter flavus TaxID=2576071 RepID=UPI001408A93B|nr:prephenate dehydrogenase/arogenate dehydrogenase family protein [Phragmitibacter flavus]
MAILGPGLLGGSLLMALRQKLPGVHLRAWARRREAVAELEALELAEICSDDLAMVVEGADLVVICTPVRTMAVLGRQLAKLPLAKGAVVTDVGSVKAMVVAGMEEALSGSGFDFVGSHPMAGSERAGLEAARANLFEGQGCLITPTLFTTDRALGVVREFWRLMGCRLLEMGPEEHDRCVARISHMPHLAAAAVTLAAMQDDHSVRLCVGNGFRDTTRVASGNPDLWTGIVFENRDEVLHAVRAARDRFSDLVDILEKLDEDKMRQFLRESKVLRDLAAPNV